MNLSNNKTLKIDIEKICNIFKKEKITDLTQDDWNLLKEFKNKLTMSSSFAHKFCKKSREF